MKTKKNSFAPVGRNEQGVVPFNLSFVSQSDCEILALILYFFLDEFDGIASYSEECQLAHAILDEIEEFYPSPLFISDLPF